MPPQSDQRATSDFTTPTPEQIVTISAQHVALMEQSDADSAWIWVGMEHLLLRTRCRSGATPPET